MTTLTLDTSVKQDSTKLSNHADEALDMLNREEQRIAEVIFGV